MTLPFSGFPDNLSKCAFKAGHIQASSSQNVFLNPKIKRSTTIDNSRYSIKESKQSKRSPPTQATFTWNADGASVSKLLGSSRLWWGGDVNSKRCSGPFNLTCKFSVDIALKTLLFLLVLLLFLIDSTVISTAYFFYRPPVLKFYYLPYVCRSLIRLPSPDFHPVES